MVDGKLTRAGRPCRPGTQSTNWRSDDDAALQPASQPARNSLFNLNTKAFFELMQTVSSIAPSFLYPKLLLGAIASSSNGALHYNRNSISAPSLENVSTPSREAFCTLPHKSHLHLLPHSHSKACDSIIQIFKSLISRLLPPHPPFPHQLHRMILQENSDENAELDLSKLLSPTCRNPPLKARPNSLIKLRSFP
jgi:hypothetical protein